MQKLLSRRRIRKSSWLSLLILIGAGIVAVLVLIATRQSPPDEIFLLPENYRGPILIVYEQPDGQPLKHENGSIIYEVPANGILQVNFSVPQRWLSQAFYYVDRSGNRMQIPVDSYCTRTLPDNPIVACSSSFATVLEGVPNIPSHRFFKVGESEDLVNGKYDNVKDDLLRTAVTR